MLHPIYYIFNPCTPVYHCIPKYRSSEVKLDRIFFLKCKKRGKRQMKWHIKYQDRSKSQEKIFRINNEIKRLNVMSSCVTFSDLP